MCNILYTTLSTSDKAPIFSTHFFWILQRFLLFTHRASFAFLDGKYMYSYIDSNSLQIFSIVTRTKRDKKNQTSDGIDLP